MSGVTRLKHARLATPDVPRMADYYQEIMGLEVLTGDGKAVHLACPGADASVILGPGREPRCEALALEAADEDDVERLAAAAQTAGVVTDRRSDAHPGASLTSVLHAPHGIAIELQAAAKDTSRVAGGGDKPIAPRKLGHVAFNVSDVGEAVSFYTDILGFRVSDWMGDFFAFLRCGPDHHTVNVLPGQRHKMHHIAFEAADWGAIRSACDHLGPRGYPLIWGPGRHGIGHNIFIYHTNPDGQIVELYTELDQMSDESSGAFDPRPWHEDRPQRPKVWDPGPATSNQWGIPTPDRFRD